MNTHNEGARAILSRRKLKGWVVCAIAFISFGAGSLITARLMRANRVKAESNRVFELMIYHALPGKGLALESLFRDVSKLQTKHGLDVVGYWVPSDDSTWKDTFIYIIAHPSRDEAEKNWKALHADPDFPPYRKSAEALIQKVNDEFNVDEIFMRPSDFSALK